MDLRDEFMVKLRADAVLTEWTCGRNWPATSPFTRQSWRTTKPSRHVIFQPTVRCHATRKSST